VTPRIVVIGVGNRLRGDDGAGLAVADEVRSHAGKALEVRVCEQEPSRLIDAFGDADVALIADAVSTGAAPGTVHRFDASDTPIRARALQSSTHAFGIGETLELARALDRLPGRTVVFGVEGLDFTAREGLTPAVAGGVSRAAGAVLEEVAACTNRR
jgi:hydrogenase maturation protease